MAFPGTAANNVTLLIPPYSPDDTQRKFPRKNEALGAIQIIIALIHLGLGGILFFSSKESVPLCMASWYPFWGAGLFIISGSLSAAAATAKNITEGLEAGSNMLNAISFLASLAGGIMLGIDLINICILNKYKVSIPILDKIRLVSFLLPLRCEESPIPWDYCQSISSYNTGILALMLIFSVIQNIVSKAAVSSDSDKSQDHKAEQVFPLLSPPQPQFSNGTSPPWQQSISSI
ncbi:B-lymphocyte antigen CD20-like [Mauremys mutica]|uniref:Uncharacterized protein n=1 Tax=Mauremys mutica TaxID=74926 RepID=A0A9D3X1T1_9SAUR|nr:B-lymphocyte antigen CD20-like [Mauremys mutica]KAH1172249.1 hypothetical protein KIL84_007867 [Mauremys mutica]